jgi:hypothetical protein
MPFGTPALKVEGLDETVRGLRKIDKELPKVLALQHREAATNIQQGAQRRLAGEPVPKRTGVIGRSATARHATITLKYSRYPWAAGAEFGSIRYRQFRRWRGNQFTPQLPGGPGYLIQPTIAQKLPQLDNDYADAVLRAFKQAGVVKAT